MTDTETTGLEIGEHRFVEVYAALYDLASRTLVAEYNERINPQRSISPGAEAVHHISLADLQGKPTWDMIAPKFHAFLNRAELIVAHNGVDFDMPFINYEVKRAGLTEIVIPCFDTMKEARWATPQGKSPTLSELCFACGVSYDPAKAHAADYDVGMMTECFWRGLDWGFYKVPAVSTILAVAV